MSSIQAPLAPSSSLPPLRTIPNIAEKALLAALQNLSALYCPLPVISIKSDALVSKSASNISVTPIDSGYTSETEDDFEFGNSEDILAMLRADGFERSFSERWLTTLIARVDELSCFGSEEAQEHALDLAYCVLESLCCPVSKEEVEPETDFSRTFSFEASLTPSSKDKLPIDVQLNDGLAGMNDTDPDDVGLQSWGASIVFSKLLCASPGSFGLTQPSGGRTNRIIELGAGTGLVSLVLGKLLPELESTSSKIIATDYHPAVLANLRSNVSTNFPNNPEAVETAHLDWSSPTLEPPFDVPADILVATDAVYGLEHAVWLRDCASRLLVSHGVFWLMLTVRVNGKFKEIAKSVEVAFAAGSSTQSQHEKTLRILDTQLIAKYNNIGRADESGYKLFKIGWA